MNMKHKAPFYMGGGIETRLDKFNLQRFAYVDNPYEFNIDNNKLVDIEKQKTLVDLSRYAIGNIANYRTVTELPQENIEYLSSGLSASSCRLMFNSCSSLTSIPWDEFNIDTSQCTDISEMFSLCASLKSIDLSTMNINNTKTMYNIFTNCYDITTINLTNFNTANCYNFSNLFRYCWSLQEIICPDGFDLSGILSTSASDYNNYINHMFEECNSYNSEPLHFKNVPRYLGLDFSNTDGVENIHYIIDNYLD